MPKDYSTSTADVQMSHGELTADQILKLMNLDPKNYKVEKSFSGDAVDAGNKQVKNVQVYQWVLYKRENGDWVKTKITKKWFDSKKLSVNGKAIYSENGIVILKPFEIARDENLKVGPPGKQNEISDNANASDDTSGSNTTTSEDGGYCSSFWYEPVGYRGDDEKLIKNISFIKLCLLKECYEGLGILL